MAALNAIKVLTQFAADHVEECPLDEQIRIYQALSELLPSETARSIARQLSVALSQSSALQLDFTQSLRSENGQP